MPSDAALQQLDAEAKADDHDNVEKAQRYFEGVMHTAIEDQRVKRAQRL